MRKFFKRAFDILVSGIALFLLWPVLAFTAFLVWLKLGSPILFMQVRPGLNARTFRIIKFRSMLNERDEAGEMLSDEQRLTRFGRILRSTSLDELPQLINVFKGDLSLVGPRPLLVEYLPLYSKEQARRHLVRPGITGWAQVNGRNSLTWEDKFELDIWYVDNHTLWLDLKILMLTAVRVFQRKGISADGQSTMPPFRGTDGSTVRYR